MTEAGRGPAPGAPPEAYSEAPLEAPRGSRARELADAALQRWFADGRDQLLPRDRLCLVLRCGACSDERVVGFRIGRSPYFGEPPMPLYRDLGELLDLLEEAHRRPLADVDPEAWEATRRCSCGALPHACETVFALLFRSMRGTGACLVAEVDAAGRRSVRRCPVDGVPEPIAAEPLSLYEAFGRPLSLLGLLTRLSAGEGPAVRAIRVEPGVAIWWAEPGQPLEAAVSASNDGRALCVVEAADEMAEGPSWPRRLKDTWDDRALGTRAAIAVDRGRLRRVVATLAARYLGAELRDNGPDALGVRQDGFTVSVSVVSLVRSMIAHGRTLSEAAARALEAADATRVAVLDLVRAFSQVRPELVWRVEDGRLTCVRSDGSAGRSVDVVELAAAIEPDSPDVEREAAYLANDLPEWADPTRLCACGAPVTIVARVMDRESLDAFARDHAGARPAFVEVWGEPETTAAAVVALGCERHVRVPTEAELLRLGLDAATVRRRLESDVREARLSLNTKTLESEAGSRAVLVRGPLAAAAFRVDEWVRAILLEIGEPLRGEHVEVWSFFEGSLILVEESWAEVRRPLLARASAVFCGRDPTLGPRFAIQRRVPREGLALGRVTVRCS